MTPIEKLIEDEGPVLKYDEPVNGDIKAAVMKERERCLALLKLEQESVQEAKLKFGASLYIDGWIDALARLKVKFEDKTDE